MPWFVSFETRPHGAIGIFETRGLSSGESTRDAAIAEVQAALNARGLETRFPVKVYEYDENTED